MPMLGPEACSCPGTVKSVVPDGLVVRRRGVIQDVTIQWAVDETGRRMLDTERVQTPDSESVQRIFVEPLDPTRNWGKCFHG